MELFRLVKQMEKILEYIGNTTDGEKYIIDKKTKERELSIDSSEIRKEEIGAIFPGSKVFIKKNIAGFSQYLAEYHHKFFSFESCFSLYFRFLFCFNVKISR